MALIRWEPAAELNTIQNEMNRLFNSLFDSPSQQQGSGTSQARRWIPAMDLAETGDQYVLRADLPGMSEQDIKIEVESNVLTISGERKSEHEQHQGGYLRVERGWGTFSRSLTLPEGVRPDAVQAHFDRGVLEIRIPKPEEQKPQKVTINVGSSSTGTGNGQIVEGTASNVGGGSELSEAPVGAGAE